ncbi:MAG: hypothetical protein ACI81L_001923 [Verrucomicrobiales bacterium]
MTQFNASVFQNEYLPEGGDVVDAVVTVTAVEGGAVAKEATPIVEVIAVDVSGSMNEDGGAKIKAARTATVAAIDSLVDGVLFAVIAGNHEAKALYPPHGQLVEATPESRAEAQKAAKRIHADGGTAIGSWLRGAKSLIEGHRESVAHVILLTDGRNEHEKPWELDAAIADAVGLFECDCRGLGVNWEPAELRKISNALLGTTDIISNPEDMEAEFTALTQKTMSKAVTNVALRLWTPKGSETQFVKQVAPNLEQMSDKAQAVDALTNDFPLGSWADGESRDYHVRIKIPTGTVGDERLAARVMLAVNGEAEPVALVRAIWTNDDALSTRINREVAHYTGQAELADAIADGLAARQAGDEGEATLKLGRAVQIAHEAGNDGTVRLLKKVVDIEDPETGTVRLKRAVEQADAMALDVRSTRTVRVERKR